MSQRATGLILCLLACPILGSGCSERASEPASEDSRGQLQEGAAASDVDASDAPDRADAPREYAGPAGPRAVLAAAEPPAQELAAWALDEQAPAKVRVTSLQRLEARDGGAALAAAEAVLAAPESDPQLRANAVAVLARSQDPQADALLAGLEPKYQRLAQALRSRQER